MILVREKSDGKNIDANIKGLTPSLGYIVKAMALLLLPVLFAGCASTPSEEGAVSGEPLNFEKEILESFGEISFENAILYDLVSYVSTEIDKQGTANIIVGDDEFGETALHVACLHGSVESVQLLLSRGADPGIRDSVGYFPVAAAWDAIYSRANKNADTGATGRVEPEDRDKYVKILRMLAIPEKSFEPRSIEVEEAVAQEAFIKFLFANGPPSLGNTYYLKVNGRDVSNQTLKVVGEHGYKVFAASKNPEKEKNGDFEVDLEWVSDSSAKIKIFQPFFEWKGTVTYAYGHWMFDILSVSDIF